MQPEIHAHAANPAHRSASSPLDQESELIQKARSHRGVIGVMQVMPANGRKMKVGDIRIIEPNIQAGTKYMDQLMSKFSPDSKFDADNRTPCAFASHNAGPETYRRCATTMYVRNIYKYSVAYTFTEERQEATRKAKEQVAPGTGR